MTSDLIMECHQTEELCRSVLMEYGVMFVWEALGIEPQKSYVPNLDIREEVWVVYV